MNRYSLFVATLLLLFSQWTFAAYRIGVSIARVDDNFMTYVRTGLEAAANSRTCRFSSKMPRATWCASSTRSKVSSTRKSTR